MREAFILTCVVGGEVDVRMKVSDINKHPTVVRYYESSAQSATLDNETVDYEWVRELCLEGQSEQAESTSLLFILLD